jgi:hypothetical protein
MRDPVHHWHLWKVKGANPFQTRDIDSKLRRVRPTLMVRVDAASLAKVVLRGAGIELIQTQVILAFDECKIGKMGGNRNRATHSAIGTGTAPRTVEPLGWAHAELHGATVTGPIIRAPGVVHGGPFPPNPGIPLPRPVHRARARAVRAEQHRPRPTDAATRLPQGPRRALLLRARRRRCR